MPNISLPTGKVIYVSVYEYFFLLDDKDIDNFYQSCVADDLGCYIDDPFAQKVSPGRLELEDYPDVEEASVDEEYE